MVLEAFVLGTSGSLPLPRRSLTSVLLRREGEEILFDCGEGMQVSLRTMHVRWKNLKIICISHSHADHVTGLPGLLMLSSQVNRTEPLIIICPKAVKDYINATREHLGIYINYEIEYILLDDISEGMVYESEDKDYEITVFEGDHTRKVWGFILKERARPGKFYPEKAKALNIPVGDLWAKLQRGQKIEVNGKVIAPHQVLGESRLGRKVVYVTDTRPNNYIREKLADADLVFCESMFKHEHLEQAQEKKHMTGIEVAQMMLAAGGIRQAGLLHFSPRYSTKEIQDIEVEAQSVFSDVVACQEHSRFLINYRDK